MEVTFADRQKAKRIIDDLYRDYPPCKVAVLLGISPNYMWSARKIWKQIGREHYHCPKEVIAKILEYGKLLGMRRSTIDHVSY